MANLQICIPSITFAWFLGLLQAFGPIICSACCQREPKDVTERPPRFTIAATGHQGHPEVNRQRSQGSTSGTWGGQRLPKRFKISLSPAWDA